MKSKKEHHPLNTPAESNPGEEDTRAGNEESIESRRRRHDADSGSDGPVGNDGSIDEMLEKEKRIDPGNEHHHRSDADDRIFDDDVDRSPRFDADAGGDGTGTTGPEPGEGKNDEPDTSGEDG